MCRCGHYVDDADYHITPLSMTLWCQNTLMKTLLRWNILCHLTRKNITLRAIIPLRRWALRRHDYFQRLLFSCRFHVPLMCRRFHFFDAKMMIIIDFHYYFADATLSMLPARCSSFRHFDYYYFCCYIFVVADDAISIAVFSRYFVAADFIITWNITKLRYHYHYFVRAISHYLCHHTCHYAITHYIITPTLLMQTLRHYHRLRETLFRHFHECRENMPHAIITLLRRWVCHYFIFTFRHYAAIIIIFFSHYAILHDAMRHYTVPHYYYAIIIFTLSLITKHYCDIIMHYWCR